MAKRMTEKLGWTAERQAAEEAEVRAMFADELAFQNGDGS